MPIWNRLRLGATVGLVTAAVVASSLAATAAVAWPGRPTDVLYAAPSGSGTSCSSHAPCALPQAQAAVRDDRKRNHGIQVVLQDGTYRLNAPLQLDARDSGTPGDPVVWTAARGAHPVISGATRITDSWKKDAKTGIWTAPVPKNSASRQLYVDGAEATVAQATPQSLGFAGGWVGSATGYDIAGDAKALAIFSDLKPAQLQQVEFDYPGGNGQWTDSQRRVKALTGTTLVMNQPCWNNVTNRATYADASGTLPSMSTSQLPTTIRNAAALLHPGQWFLDQAAQTLHYWPLNDAQPAKQDVELPRLETLIQGAGTLAQPLHDVTFSGLTFSYATWNAPSEAAGFADVQSNLHMTGANNQGMCSFSTPAGTCPWGALTEPHANVSFTASSNITLSGNRFVNLGGAGLRIAYGSSNNTVDGNEFTQIASTSILLGCTADPTPVNPDPKHFPDYLTKNPDTPDTIKKNCTPNPDAVAGDTIGENEIATGNTISNNVIHRIGTDYPSASGMTLLFSRHTTVTHNELYDLPYSGITAGVIQGHVDSASHPYNSLNINADNMISNNLIHDYVTVLGDGGGVYMEGHQGQYYYQPDGKTIDFEVTMFHGLQVLNNVLYNQGPGFASFYDDAGSEWIHYQGNVQFHQKSSGISAQGGCAPTGHFLAVQNYFSGPAGSYICENAVDSHTQYNTVIPDAPQPLDVPNAVLAAAGPDASHRGFAEATAVETAYVSAPKRIVDAKGVTTQVLIAGAGYSAGTPVYFGGKKAATVQVLSPGFLIATVPAGADAGDVSVGGYILPPTITSPANGASGVPTQVAFAGTGVTGDTVTVTDGGTVLCTAVVASGSWACTGTETPGQRTVSARQTDAKGISSKSVSIVFVVGTPPSTLRVNDTDPAFVYSGYSYSGGRTYGDYLDDIHYASDNGSTITYTFVGTGITVYGEYSTDQGHYGVAIDGGAQTSVDTVPADGQRKANAVTYTVDDLKPGVHTLVLTKLDGTYMTFDGVEVAN